MMKDAAGVPYYYGNVDEDAMAPTRGTVPCSNCPLNRDQLGENLPRDTTAFLKPLCMSCWTEAHKDKVRLKDRLNLSWKLIDGSKPVEGRFIDGICFLTRQKPISEHRERFLF